MRASGGMMAAVSRSRLALIAGGFMLFSATAVGCCPPSWNPSLLGTM
jgi:hypothetical protein